MKARRILGLVALAAMALGTSCSNDELYNDYSPENAISFGTYVGHDALSRGSVITTDGTTNGTVALTEKGFGVFAYYTGADPYYSDANDQTDYQPNFMYNEKVTGSGTGTNIQWSYAPIKYWPTTTSHMISFFAYAPYDNDLIVNDSDSKHDDDPVDDSDKGNWANIVLSNNNVASSPTVTYTVPETVSQQVDLLWANPVLDAKRQGLDGKVNFKFHHALSRVGFMVEALIDKAYGQNNGDEDSSYDDNDDTNGAETTNGTVVPIGTTISVTGVTLTGNFYKTGTMNLRTVKASDVNGDDTYTPALWTNLNEASSAYSLNTANFTDAKDGVSSAKAKLNKEDAYIMVIPKNFDDDNITVTINYTVETIDDKLVGGKSTISNTVTSAPFSFNFEPGKAYNFVLHIGLTSVKFSVDISPWDPADGSDYVVNVPIEVGSTTTSSTTGNSAP